MTYREFMSPYLIFLLFWTDSYGGVNFNVFSLYMSTCTRFVFEGARIEKQMDLNPSKSDQVCSTVLNKVALFFLTGSSYGQNDQLHLNIHTVKLSKELHLSVVVLVSSQCLVWSGEERDFCSFPQPLSATQTVLQRAGLN